VIQQSALVLLKVMDPYAIIKIQHVQHIQFQHALELLMLLFVHLLDVFIQLLVLHQLVLVKQLQLHALMLEMMQ
jgi:hypothetical protein